jgi:tryptophan 2,3-dioxygenase
VAEVAGYFWQQGRAGAGADCLEMLDLIERSFTFAEGGPPSWSWFLGRWLPMLVDAHRLDCTYATYVGTQLYEDLVRTTVSADVLITTLLADLLLGEATALLEGDSGATEYRRVSTIATVLTHNRADLLGRDEVAPLWPVARSTRGDGMADAARRLAERFLAVVPLGVHRFAHLAVVPSTSVPDEIMFIRVLQLFETVFGVVLLATTAARDALVAGDGEAGAEQLEAARVALGRAMPFFRILATMPKERFAVVRQFTAGASGLQSQSFTSIEALCSLDPVSLDGAIQATAAGLEPARQARLLRAGAELDHEWLQWKRTHWAIANRLIGGVPGTGGTAGARYLRARMDGPLLPSLHESPEGDR